MTKASLPIPAFPAEIDRDYFGNYLAGFSDGEACFNLYFTSHQTPGATFTIGLRQDDSEILGLVRSYWQCGRIYFNSRVVRGKERFMAQFSVYVVSDLARVVVPHFLRYPLRAKKARDFNLWRQGVALISSRERRGKDANGLFGKRWTDEEKAQFTVLYNALRTLREYEPPPFATE